MFPWRLVKALPPSREDSTSQSPSPIQSSAPTPIGKARHVSVEVFMNSVLPPLPVDNNNLDALIDEGTFSRAVAMEGKLWGYGKKTPSEVHSEDVFHAFSSLQRGIHVIVKCLEEYEPTLMFFNRVSVGNNPRKRRRTHHSDVRSEDTLPDAFFVPVSMTRESAKWTSVAVLGEYQKDNSAESVRENVKKISQSMSNCMLKDRRRRFIYGFTVEDTSMKLWYCDRSQIVVSDPFNFIDDYRNLIHFVVSVSFAEHHELGWDPTMTPIDKDGERQFEITVRASEEETIIYRTLQVLYESSSRQVLGRGTRVWKAVKIVSGAMVGEPVAIKDVWVDEHREREGEICSQIFQSGTSAANRDALQRYIVAVETHGDVFVAGRQDRTKTFHEPCSSVKEAPQSTQMSAKSVNKRSQDAAESFRYQVHYRVVYGEIGEPLADATSLYTVFRVLIDVVHGISVLHQAGWVHRDLSSGNILVVNGVGKITDLEYATSEARPKKTGKTGTPFFVAVEVDSQKYLFRPPTISHKAYDSPPEERENILAHAFDDSSEVSSTPSHSWSKPSNSLEMYIASLPKFRYNPLHDMESIWWNAVYFTINRKLERKRDQGTSGSGGPTAAHQAFAKSLFYDFEARRAVFQEERDFSDRLRCLPRSLVTVATALERLRICLRAIYGTAEGSIDLIDSQVAKDLYSRFCEGFNMVMRSLKEDDSFIRRFAD